ncbi:aquaporin-like protein [Tothia fuscella]|uniref:Aquaporin-like protein n=1 Tax=Tothia fuscella TaxID=1048955 RepID=A0A9P4U4C3_9PEZI|nr:aquaporin-like protein [Tothia fuscella]
MSAQAHASGGRRPSSFSRTASKDFAPQTPSLIDDYSRRSTLDDYVTPSALDGHTLPFEIEFEKHIKRPSAVVKPVNSRTRSSLTYVEGSVVSREKEHKEKEKAKETETETEKEIAKERDVETATPTEEVLKSKRTKRLRQKYFGNDTKNLYSPLVEFIATFIMVLLVVSTNLAVSARPERTLDMNVLTCRLVGAMETKLNLTKSQPDCGVPYRSDDNEQRLQQEFVTIPHSPSIKLLVTSLSSGLAAMVAIYIAGGLSSAHLNPIVTLAVKIVDNPEHFTIHRCLIYFAVQTLAAFLAGLLGIGIHLDAIKHHCKLLTMGHAKPSNDCIGYALYLIPSPALTWWGALLSDMTATCVLILIVMALRDKNQNKPGANMGGLISGLCIVALGLSMGLNTGGATNPVRDFGPRLAAATIGVQSWDDKHYWAIWGPWLVPTFGGTIGAVIYKFVIKPITTQKAKIEKQQLREEMEELREERRDLEGFQRWCTGMSRSKECL